MSIQLTFPDGSTRPYEDGVTGMEVAAAIGPRLAKAAVAARVDGELVDLTRGIESDSSFEVITDSTETGRHVLRHSAAHVMAQAVLDLYEGAAFAIGPTTTLMSVGRSLPRISWRSRNAWARSSQQTNRSIARS
jgi:threonyl-tRNA synthetase